MLNCAVCDSCGQIAAYTIKDRSKKTYWQELCHACIKSMIEYKDVDGADYEELESMDTGYLEKKGEILR